MHDRDFQNSPQNAEIALNLYKQPADELPRIELEVNIVA